MCLFTIFVLAAFLTYLFLVMKVKSLSRVRLFATPWTVEYQVPPSMGFSRQEYSSSSKLFTVS